MLHAIDDVILIENTFLKCKKYEIAPASRFKCLVWCFFSPSRAAHNCCTQWMIHSQTWSTADRGAGVFEAENYDRKHCECEGEFRRQVLVPFCCWTPGTVMAGEKHSGVKAVKVEDGTAPSVCKYVNCSASSIAQCEYSDRVEYQLRCAGCRRALLQWSETESKDLRYRGQNVYIRQRFDIFRLLPCVCKAWWTVFSTQIKKIMYPVLNVSEILDAARN